jgi:hypothetical protein
MRQIRIDTPKPRRRRTRHEVLPIDPRDPDVLRAKSLAYGGSWARPWFGHSEGPRPEGGVAPPGGPPADVEDRAGASTYR